MQQPLISIITVNYNQAALTVEFIRSIQASDYSNFEIIVVDNCSPEDASWIQDSFPNIIYIAAPENGGFAYGNNLGIEKAKGEYLFFINNDTTITKNCLSLLLNFCQQKSNVGAVSPRIVYADTPSKVQFSGGYLNPFTSQIVWQNQQKSEQEHQTFECETDIVHGAAMFVPAKVIKDIGGMPEEYFLLYEEFDWSLTIRKAGYKLYYFGTPIVYHKVSQSIKNSPFKAFYMARNRLLFIRRHFIGVQKFSSFLFVTLITVPKSILKHSLLKEWAQVKAILKGVLWHLNHIIL